MSTVFNAARFSRIAQARETLALDKRNNLSVAENKLTKQSKIYVKQNHEGDDPHHRNTAADAINAGFYLVVGLHYHEMFCNHCKNFVSVN